MAVRRQADRNVLSARPNILRDAVAASFAETKDASGGPKMLSWQPERIILSHGRWFDSNASETLQRTFGWAL
jgi:hypothetical protein